jgi:hypothetical protein
MTRWKPIDQISGKREGSLHVIEFSPRGGRKVSLSVQDNPFLPTG